MVSSNLNPVPIGFNVCQRPSRKEGVHTSAATVAVIPKFEVEDIEIRKDELKVDTFRSSGAGGQHRK